MKMKIQWMITFTIWEPQKWISEVEIWLIFTNWRLRWRNFFCFFYLSDLILQMVLTISTMTLRSNTTGFDRPEHLVNFMWNWDLLCYQFKNAIHLNIYWIQMLGIRSYLQKFLIRNEQKLFFAFEHCWVT